jgi:hypothetical protein
VKGATIRKRFEIKNSTTTGLNALNGGFHFIVRYGGVYNNKTPKDTRVFIIVNE